MSVPAVSFRREEDTWGARFEVCEVCQYAASSEADAHDHYDLPHYECPGCGETYSAENHPNGDVDPILVGGTHYCSPDCAHNHLHDHGYVVHDGALLTVAEPRLRSIWRAEAWCASCGRPCWRVRGALAAVVEADSRDREPFCSTGCHTVYVERADHAVLAVSA